MEEGENYFMNDEILRYIRSRKSRTRLTEVDLQFCIITDLIVFF
jgi:hypothetical protein